MHFSLTYVAIEAYVLHHQTILNAIRLSETTLSVAWHALMTLVITGILFYNLF